MISCCVSVVDGVVVNILVGVVVVLSTIVRHTSHYSHCIPLQ